MKTKTKTHWKNLANTNFLGAYSLAINTDNEDNIIYKELNAIIEKVVKEVVKDTTGKEQECTVAYLKGQKPMILNKTNCKAITKAYHTPFIEEWAGKNITIYVAKIRAFGEDVDALRIKSDKPELPELKPNTPEWQKCITAMRGTYDIDDIKKKYTISKANETKIKNEVDETT